MYVYVHVYVYVHTRARNDLINKKLVPLSSTWFCEKSMVCMAGRWRARLSAWPRRAAWSCRSAAARHDRRSGAGRAPRTTRHTLSHASPLARTPSPHTPWNHVLCCSAITSGIRSLTTFATLLCANKLLRK